MTIDDKYNISNEIKDELSIGIYCSIVEARGNNNKSYKIYTLNYLNYLEHLLSIIKHTFNDKLAFNINSEFIDEVDLRNIAFNMLIIILHNNSKGALLNYVTSIFDYEYSFSILTGIGMLENDLDMFLEKELGIDFFILDVFNIHKDTMDLITRGRE